MKTIASACWNGLQCAKRRCKRPHACRRRILEARGVDDAPKDRGAEQGDVDGPL